MRLFLCLILFGTTAMAEGRETRCGWYSNPTPANYDLQDADGYWFLSVQGRGEVSGFFDATEVAGPRGDWVQMSPAGYGFGCACIRGDFGPVGSGTVHEVFTLRRLQLAQCATDPALPVRDLTPIADD